jgi:hypothetical protein
MIVDLRQWLPLFVCSLEAPHDSVHDFVVEFPHDWAPHSWQGLFGFGIPRQLDQLAQGSQLSASGSIDKLLECGLELRHGLPSAVLVDYHPLA